MKSELNEIEAGRRAAVLRVLSGAGMAAVASLAGCAAGGGNLVGQPIDDDPELKRVRPTTARAPMPTGGLRAGAVGWAMERAVWTNEKPREWLADQLPRVSRITIHHDGMPTRIGKSAADAADRLRRIRKVHVVDNGWADIGYHYAVDPGGRVWACRPTRLQGAHVKYNNEENLGIVMLGNFNQARVTPEAQRALVRLVNEQRLVHGVGLSAVKTHQEMRPTECPGRNLQSLMDWARAGSGPIAMA